MSTYLQLYQMTPNCFSNSPISGLRAHHEFWLAPVPASPGHCQPSQLAFHTTQVGLGIWSHVGGLFFSSSRKACPTPHPSHSKEPSTVHWGTKRPLSYVVSAQSLKGGRPAHSWVLTWQASTHHGLQLSILSPPTPTIIIPYTEINFEFRKRVLRLSPPHTPPRSLRQLWDSSPRAGKTTSVCLLHPQCLVHAWPGSGAQRPLLMVWGS